MTEKTLVLGRKEVEEIISMPEVIDAVERALKSGFSMPPKVYLEVPKYNGDFRAMPCFLEPYCEVKWVNVYPENPQKYGLPTVMATIVLNDARNAFPLAVMDGTIITKYRTGAIAGIASKYLARKNSSTFGLIGSGVQAHTQLLAVSSVFNLKEARVWNHNFEKAEDFVEEMKGKVSCKLVAVKNIEEACASDIVSTITPSREPIVMEEFIKPGTHINAIGADAAGKQELEPSILKKAKIVVDDIHQAVHGGEPNVAIAKGIISEKDLKYNIVDVVKGMKVRESDADITIFTSTGLAVQDAATAALVFEKARKKGIGEWVELV